MATTAVVIAIVVGLQLAFGVIPVPAYRPPYQGGARSYHLVYRDDEPRFYWCCIAVQLLAVASFWGVEYLLH